MKRSNAMAKTTREIENNEEELTTFEISDEALEMAGADEMAQYTLAACTGLSVCPG